MFLTAINGYVDAYTYATHGVFAGAQTGNLILLSVGLADHPRADALVYLWPILAFSAGVVAARLIERAAGANGSIFHPLSRVLLLEAGVLALVGLLPVHIPQSAITVSIGFTSALQVVLFQAVKPANFITIAMTGNLMRTIITAFTALQTRTSDDTREAAIYASVIVSFAFGAGAGGVITVAMGSSSSLVAAGALALTWGLLALGHRRYVRRGEVP
ncbi:YoaK family protein [Streptomyces sp. NPDC059985]|uniref:YoaK family protein n=1 Tax=Streptomyces sp. NPDC059985 TaxID=3347025 RepID=UPI0036AA8FFD